MPANWLPAASGVLAPIWNEAPPERIERNGAGLMVTPDNKQVLAWCSIPARRIVVRAAVAHIHALDDAVA